MDSSNQPDLLPNRAQEIMDQIERLMDELAVLTPDAPSMLERLFAGFRARVAVVRFFA